MSGPVTSNVGVRVTCCIGSSIPRNVRRPIQDGGAKSLQGRTTVVSNYPMDERKTHLDSDASLAAGSDASFRVYLDGWVVEKFLKMNVTVIWHDLQGMVRRAREHR